MIEVRVGESFGFLSLLIDHLICCSKVSLFKSSLSGSVAEEDVAFNSISEFNQVVMSFFFSLIVLFGNLMVRINKQ